MAINLRVLTIMGILIAAVVMLTGAAFANGNASGARPGWGFGDKNHVHTGPPGHSVHP